MNTREIVRNLQLLGGSIALFTIAGTGYIMGRALRHHKTNNANSDDSSTEKWTGTIQNVECLKEKEELTQTVAIKLKTKGEEILVFLGPAWYINHQKKQLNKGDKITVLGTAIEVEGDSLIIATRVIHNNTRLMLRDEQGMPYWDNWRQVG
ncbi:hypothetical protein [Fodinibius halophilus]|uniref:Magnetosome protein MamS/MamX domain-containing protein n=1 Tax=Fodinibius halophilus TaxID=1736908 RepID=A0A6M1T1A2_9BACT|nr:hypothetical protein [Fodinibius halophilus]NGP89858.1 hypothetical protein [Fodinibius halophilus]